MSQIDYFFAFANEAAAISDPVVQAHFNVDWMRDHVLPNVAAIRISTGLPFAGWFVLVSTKVSIPALLNHAALQFALDRDKAIAAQPFVVRNNIGATITDVMVSPIFAGSKYPVGGFN
jgi:hypothetical protein